MSNLGLGVTLQYLSGNEETINTVKAGIGNSIRKLTLTDENELVFEFDNGFKFKIYDAGQSCCEDRYMRTDDYLDDYVGGKLLDIEVVEGGNSDNNWGEHEIQFLVVKTDKGTFKMSNHNEHNGYYGGFAIVAVPLV